jgi:hypothetical protein
MAPRRMTELRKMAASCWLNVAGRYHGGHGSMRAERTHLESLAAHD